MELENHRKKCTICSNNLHDELMDLRKKGYNYQRIAEILSKRHGVTVTPKSIQRHITAYEEVSVGKTLEQAEKVLNDDEFDKLIESFDSYQALIFERKMNQKLSHKIRLFFQNLLENGELKNIRGETLRAYTYLLDVTSREVREAIRTEQFMSQMTKDQAMQKLVDMLKKYGVDTGEFVGQGQ